MMATRSTPSLSIPQTQNTAPVFEFNCLYTHDVRRKQKRWQDGFLRFHTFNKRIMVYDVPRNFIGDAHWNAEDLQEGDEVNLEKGGVLVQVGETSGRTETDLTALIKTKKASSSVAASSSPLRAPPIRVQDRTPAAVSRNTAALSAPLKHRSLNALLGASKGQLGKATLLEKSPFDKRHEAGEARSEADRPTKRQRMNDTAPMRSNITTTTTSRDIMSMTRTSNIVRSSREVINLCSDPPDSSGLLAGDSDNLLDSPAPAHNGGQRSRNMSVAVRSSTPAFETRTTPVKEKSRKRNLPIERQSEKGRTQSDASVALTVREVAHVSEKAVSDKQTASMDSRDRVGGRVYQSRQTSEIDQPTPGQLGFEQRQPDQKKDSSSSRFGKVLRIATSAPKRKMLLCQDRLSIGVPVTSHSRDLAASVSHNDGKSKHFEPTSQRQQLQQRLERLAKKSRKRTEGPMEYRQQSKVGTIEPHPACLPHLVKQPIIAHTVQGTELQPFIPAKSNTSQRQLRRVMSESLHRSQPSPNAVSAPVEAATGKTPATEHLAGSTAGNSTSTTLGRFKTKKPFNRAVSLNVTPNGTSTVILNREFRLPQPTRSKEAIPEMVANPWSREAFDLFTWRPPGWDEHEWCIKKADTTTV